MSNDHQMTASFYQEFVIENKGQELQRNLLQCNQPQTFFLQTYTRDDCYNWPTCTDQSRDIQHLGVTGDDETEEFFVVGTFINYSCHSSTGNPSQDCIVQKYSYDINKDDTCEDIRLSADKYLYTVGTSVNSNNNNDAVLFKISSIDGSYQWGRAFDCGGSEQGRSVAIQDDGGVIYISGVFGTIQNNINAFILKIDDSGNQIWLRAWASDSWEYNYMVLLTKMGKYIYMLGSTSAYADGTNHGMQDASITKFRYDGEHQWSLYEGRDTYHEFFLYSVAAQDDSFMIGCGYRCQTTGCTDQRVMISRYLSDGTHTNSKQFAEACAMTRDEKVLIVVGWTWIMPMYTTNPDQFFIKIRADNLGFILMRQYDDPYAQVNRNFAIFITSQMYMIKVGDEDNGSCPHSGLYNCGVIFKIDLDGYDRSAASIKNVASSGSNGDYTDITDLTIAKYTSDFLTRVPLVAVYNISTPSVCTYSNGLRLPQYTSGQGWFVNYDTWGALGQPIIKDIYVSLGQTVTVQLPNWCSRYYSSPTCSFFNAFVTFTDTSPSSMRQLQINPTLSSQLGTHYLVMRAAYTQDTNHLSGQFFKIFVQDSTKPLLISSAPSDVTITVGYPLTISLGSIFSQTCASWQVRQLQQSGKTKGLPTWLFFDLDNKNISGTPSNADLIGTENSIGIYVACFDGQGRKNSVSFNLTVTNLAPVFYDDVPDQILQANQFYKYRIPTEFFEDPDSHPVLFTATLTSLAALPSWLFFDSATGIFQGYPPSSLTTHQQYTILLTAYDPYLYTATQTFKILINRQPSIASGGIPTRIYYLYNATALYVGFSSYFTDADSDTLYYQIEQTNNQPLPNYMIFDQMTGIMNLTWSSTQGGYFRMRMTASDPYEGLYSQNFELILNTAPSSTQDTIYTYGYLNQRFAFQVNSSHLWDDNDLEKDLSVTITVNDFMNSTYPSWLEFSPTDWILFGTPSFLPEDQKYSSNTLSLIIKATDPYGESASFTLEVTILENTAPKLINKFLDLSFYNQTSFSIDMSNRFADSDKDELIYYVQQVGSKNSSLPWWIGIICSMF
eukprot:403338241